MGSGKESGRRTGRYSGMGSGIQSGKESGRQTDEKTPRKKRGVRIRKMKQKQKQKQKQKVKKPKTKTKTKPKIEKVTGKITIVMPPKVVVSKTNMSESDTAEMDKITQDNVNGIVGVGGVIAQEFLKWQKIAKDLGLDSKEQEAFFKDLEPRIREKQVITLDADLKPIHEHEHEYKRGCVCEVVDTEYSVIKQIPTTSRMFDRALKNNDIKFLRNSNTGKPDWISEKDGDNGKVKLYILGCAAGGAINTLDNVTSSYLIEITDSIRPRELVMFDCGHDGIVNLMYNINPKFINTPLVIFISHNHIDHISGLPMLIFNFIIHGRTAPLTIVTPDDKIDAMLSVILPDSMNLKAMKFDCKITRYGTNEDGNTDGVVYDDDKEFDDVKNKIKDFYTVNDYTRRIFFGKNDRWVVISEENNHSVKPSLAFRFQYLQPITLNTEQLEKDNIDKRFWRDYSYTKSGYNIKYSKKDKDIVICYSGDTQPLNRLADNLFKNADVLLHDATFNHDDIGYAIQTGHCTTKSAIMIGNCANATKIFLIHSGFKSIGRGEDLRPENNESEIIREQMEKRRNREKGMKKKEMKK